jgi:hypothetical protein
MIGNFLNKLEKVRGSKGRWVACCPAHVDRSPSLAITETDDGRILLKCFAGCSAQQVVEAVGMDLTDLFPNDNNISSLKEKHFNKPVRRPFYATDLLKIIQFEALLTSVAAFDLSQGREVSTEDRKRLKTALSRINEAVSYIN